MDEPAELDIWVEKERVGKEDLGVLGGMALRGRWAMMGKKVGEEESHGVSKTRIVSQLKSFLCPSEVAEGL